MNSLVKKDFMVARGYIAYIVAMAIAFGVLFSFKVPATIILIGTAIIVSLTGSMFSYDAACRWDRFAVSCGITRRSIVRSRFQTSLVLVLVGILVSGTTMTLYVVATDTVLTMEDAVSGVLVGIGVGLMIGSVNCAVNYMAEPSKAQVLSTLSMAITSIVAVSIGAVVNTIFAGVPLLASAMLVAAGALVMVLCYRVSLSRFSRRDL